MKTLIIYYSQHGSTEVVARTLAKELKTDILEVTDLKNRSGFKNKLTSCIDSIKETKTEIAPSEVDLTEYDSIYIGTPTWAGKPTPAINGGIEGLTGCQGKHAFVLLTCKSTESGEQALISMVERLKAKGISISGTVVLDQAGSIEIETIQTVIRDIASL